MDLGVAIFFTDRTPTPARLAPAVEESGFDSLWTPEHTHIPVQHSPYPAGGELPDMYRRTLDPFVALATAAAATERLLVATGICLVAQRDPIVLAKEVATLDLLSGGRFVFGVGYGWNRPEVEHHGVAFADRRDVLRERVLAMRALWTSEEAAFEGQHVRLSPSWAWPEPVQDPHPPIYLGAAAGPRTLDHLVEFCDGWLPQGRYQLESELPALRRRLEEAGRDPDTFPITVIGTKPEPARLEQLAELGAERTVLWLPSEDEATVMRRLDEFAALRETFAAS